HVVEPAISNACLRVGEGAAVVPVGLIDLPINDLEPSRLCLVRVLNDEVKVVRDRLQRLTVLKREQIPLSHLALCFLTRLRKLLGSTLRDLEVEDLSCLHDREALTL